MNDKFLEELDKFIKLELTKTDSFNCFCKFIQKKEVKNIVQNFLKSLNIEIKPQIILSIYLIYNYPKYVLNNSIFDNDIKKLCNNIVEYISLDNKEITKINLESKFMKFNEMFLIWHFSMIVN